MGETYWHRQTINKPLFPELLWSQPENKRHAGKLVIIGGNAHGFASPAEAYQAGETAGVGVARVVLPNAIQKLVGGFFETAFFAPSTPSGSFAKQSFSEFMEHAAWADGVLLAGDLSRNSETATVLEKFIHGHKGQLTITKDAADYFQGTPKLLLQRPETTLVVSLAQLQKIVQKSGFSTPVTFDMSLMKLVEVLHELTDLYPANIIVKHLDQIAVAANGGVSTTRLKENKEIWRVQTAAAASVWWLQNPTKTFEALTTSIAQKDH